MIHLDEGLRPLVNDRASLPVQVSVVNLSMGGVSGLPSPTPSHRTTNSTSTPSAALSPSAVDIDASTPTAHSAAVTASPAASSAAPATPMAEGGGGPAGSEPGTDEAGVVAGVVAGAPVTVQLQVLETGAVAIELVVDA